MKSQEQWLTEQVSYYGKKLKTLKKEHQEIELSLTAKLISHQYCVVFCEPKPFTIRSIVEPLLRKEIEGDVK